MSSIKKLLIPVVKWSKAASDESEVERKRMAFSTHLDGRLKTQSAKCSMVSVALLFVACTQLAAAKTTKEWDSENPKFTANKDFIKINRTPKVSKTVQSLLLSEPARAVRWKKIFANADKFVQRSMNGDLNQMEIPKNWNSYNGPIMGMSMGDWDRLVNSQTDKDFTQWNVCPEARIVSITTRTDKTVIRYEFVTVGRFTMQDKFSTAESGKPYFLDVVLNDKARVVDRKQTPVGANASPYIRVDESSSICRLKDQKK